MKPTERSRAIAKTLLVLWPHLEDYGQMLEQKIMRHAEDSFHSPAPTEQIMNKIIDINAKKDTIRKLKQEIDCAIERLTPISRKIIKKYYSKTNREKTIKDIAAENGMPERSFFRRIDSATTELAMQLNDMGINAFTWSYLLIHHSLIKSAFDREQKRL
jgi:DNA-directed RNA polymerase specialized sigma subunit